MFIQAQLAAIDDENRIEKMIKKIPNKDNEDFWESQIVSARTLHISRTVLKDAMGERGIPKQILGPALESLPEEIQQILIYFSTL